jgi:hypothetical protein
VNAIKPPFFLNAQSQKTNDRLPQQFTENDRSTNKKYMLSPWRKNEIK